MEALSQVASNSVTAVVIIAIIVGAVPALAWLAFWLHEDHKHPEPRSLIFLAFLAGALAVPVVIPIQIWLEEVFFTGSSTGDASTSLIFAWAAAEEVIKLTFCSALLFWRKEVDEPIDYIIYLLSTALGFAALENAYFLAAPLLDANLPDIISVSNARFLGANLLHAIASALIGVSLALAVGHGRILRIVAIVTGTFSAIALHSFFNLALIFQDGNAGALGFLAVWIAGVLLLFTIEKIKILKPFITSP